MAEKQTKYFMDEDESKRMRSRHANMDLIRKLHTDSNQADDENHRSMHCCYVQLVGIIPGYQLKENSKNYKDESVEQYLDELEFYKDMNELEDKREEYVLYEDNMARKLMKSIEAENSASYAALVRACGRYEKTNYMMQHEATSNRSHVLFCNKDLNIDEAKACAFAIAFYTGSYCETLNRNSAIFARNENRNASTNMEVAKSDPQATVILYYLIKGLSYISYYWGVTTRSVQLKPEELADYKPGVVVTWLQFSSANKGEVIPDWFAKRNTIFKIYSLTGRSIREYSNCSEDEDEVLFLPYSSFLVCHVEKINGKHSIHLRQIELGLCKYTVLWVDDHIFDEWWENKEHMEKASALGTGRNVRFIPKSNTESALSFLRSPFGRKLKSNSRFRIITDMNRDNELQSNTAGVRLIKMVRELKFQQPCLIFTGDAYKGSRILDEWIPSWRKENISITEYSPDLERFVQFK